MTTFSLVSFDVYISGKIQVLENILQAERKGFAAISQITKPPLSLNLAPVSGVFLFLPVSTEGKENPKGIWNHFHFLHIFVHTCNEEMFTYCIEERYIKVDIIGTQNVSNFHSWNSASFRHFLSTCTIATIIKPKFSTKLVMGSDLKLNKSF